MIHFHSSDKRFCGSTEAGRQFSTDCEDVTCPQCRAKIEAPQPVFALVTESGTACPETALTGDEFSPDWCAHTEAQFCTGEADAPLPGTWVDVTGNDAFAA